MINGFSVKIVWNINFKETLQNMAQKKKSKKSSCGNAEVWTKEQYEEYLKELYGMEFIAGFTENCVPYGIFYDEDEENDKLEISDIYSNTSDNDDLPF